MLPGWLAENPDAIQTGSLALDQLLQVLLGTSMVLAFLIGFFLDNTIPGSKMVVRWSLYPYSSSNPKGTPEERGLVVWESQLQSRNDSPMPGDALKLYDLPVGMRFLRRYALWKMCVRYHQKNTFFQPKMGKICSIPPYIWPQLGQTEDFTNNLPKKQAIT